MKFPVLRFDSYANAEDWRDLIGNMLTKSLKDSPFDELILLLHADLPTRAKLLPKHIRTATYHRLEEVPKLLSMAPRRERPRTGAAQEIELQDEDLVPGKTPDRVDHDGPGKEKPIEPNEAQTNAAKTIQAAYRRYSKRGDIVPDGADASQIHYWQLLGRRSREMKWPKNSQYYILFRVPLGSVLVCLDVIGRFFESEKTRAKKQMRNANRVVMEALKEALNRHR